MFQSKYFLEDEEDLVLNIVSAANLLISERRFREYLEVICCWGNAIF